MPVSSRSCGCRQGDGSVVHGRRRAGSTRKKKARRLSEPFKIGGPKEDRTPDLRIANAALSQLSYRPDEAAQYSRSEARIQTALALRMCHRRTQLRTMQRAGHDSAARLRTLAYQPSAQTPIIPPSSRVITSVAERGRPTGPYFCVPVAVPGHWLSKAKLDALPNAGVFSPGC